MVDKAVILAAGPVKWYTKGGQPHHLAPVNGEPVLHRTIRQLTERGVGVVLVTDKPEIAPNGCEVWVPPPTRRLVDRILQTRELWSGTMAAVLGDVCFTEACIDRVINSDRLRWIGRSGKSTLTNGCGEVFAVVWSEDDTIRWVDALEVASEHAKHTDPQYRNGLKGSLWQPYRHLNNAHLDTHRVDRGPLWCEVNDLTDDFDTFKHYQRWCNIATSLKCA
jgi:CTP:molybdopterin cytidylyltransferase MocA